jgi:small subunit ribosomal protein S15
MALTKEEKTKVIEQYRVNESDCGSIEVQVAILTYEIRKLNGHLNINIHDFTSKRGLFMKIGHRKRLLKYLLKEDIVRYKNLITKLEIRG